MNEQAQTRRHTKVPRLNVPEVLVTIDSASTKDIDDAVSVQALADGWSRVVVCIADPTKLVLPGSTEDENAKLLGATVYAGESAVRKMLPSVISEVKGSLVAGERRKAFVFEMSLDQSLEVVSFRIGRQEIEVSHRLSYEDVPTILQDQAHACFQVISAASTLAHGLLAKRRGRGAMALYDLQRMIYMDEEGRLLQLARRDQVVGHIVVQELMILANTQLARYMVEHSIPGLFRNHVAKAAAPESSELAATMETWLKSGTADVNKAKEMFSVLLGRADYGSTARGHYALAEACYTHGTSPLRRYADLVNLRQIKCHLKNLPYVYEQDEVQALGELLTVKAIERKEERSEGFKRVVQEHAARALERGKLEHLADHEMVAAIKIAAAGGVLPAELSAELRRRLANSLVTDKITDALLLTVPAKQWDEQLRSAFVDWVALIPTRAVHLLMHAQQTGFLKELHVTAVGEGTAFEGQVRLQTDQGSVEFRAPGTRKRDAEQAACARAVLWLAGVDMEETLRIVTADASTPGVTGNPKGALLELCQQQGISSPVFEVSSQGPSHAMVFACQASLSVAGELLVGTARGCSSKKDAEAVASGDLLQQVKARASTKPSARPAPAAAPAAGPGPAASGNPKGALLEFCQKLGVTPPVFTTDAAGPAHAMSFTCTVTLQVNGQRYVATAPGRKSKKDAEAAASADLLAQLGNGVHRQGTPASAEPSNDNPVGALQEMAQKRKWASPAYVFTTLSEVPPKFRATVTVAGPKAGTYSGEATTKQEAKTRAARAALSGR